MDTCRHALLGIALALCFALTGPVTGARPSSGVTVHGASPDQEQRVAAALDSFERAGLTLPSVAITFVDDAGRCRGNDGWFEPGPPMELTVCSDLAYVVTHELAHAWIEANLDGDEEAAYTEARGLEAWNDKGLDWHERGIEDAAFVMQQNLMITRVVACTDLWLGRAAAFELLTSATSPLELEPCPTL